MLIYIAYTHTHIHIVMYTYRQSTGDADNGRGYACIFGGKECMGTLCTFLSILLQI